MWHGSLWEYLRYMRYVSLVYFDFTCILVITNMQMNSFLTNFCFRNICREVLTSLTKQKLTMRLNFFTSLNFYVSKMHKNLTLTMDAYSLNAWIQWKRICYLFHSCAAHLQKLYHTHRFPMIIFWYGSFCLDMKWKWARKQNCSKKWKCTR